MQVQIYKLYQIHKSPLSKDYGTLTNPYKI